MKNKKLAVLMSAALCLTAFVPQTTVLADGQKVVTLGADLSQEQKDAILRYFGVAGQNLQTLTITNQDERNHLGSYVPLEQIGTHTYSCALVSPTTSGGIQVKTANLSWVTSNMIASTLSTSGVVNCDVLAAAPFEVSGTGALTGIMMAYESAVGATLDTGKKEVATQELVTTTTIANNIGQIEATEIVNESKKQIIEGNVVSGNDIDVIINEVADEAGVSLTEEDRELLLELMQQIAEQDYDYSEMRDTLERVESNVENLMNQDTGIPAADSATVIDDTQPETLASDSILMNTDDSALGESVIFDATDDSALAETTAPATEAAPEVQPEQPAIDITTSDSTVMTEAPSDSTAQPENLPGESAEQPQDSQEQPADNQEQPAEQPQDNPEQPEAQITEQPADAQDQPEEPLTEDAISDETQAADPSGEMILAGEMAFSPKTAPENNYEVYPAGISRLTIYTYRDAAAGNGTLTLYNAADSSVIEQISMNDTQKVAVMPMTDEELIDLGWLEKGTKAVITLTNPIAQSMNCFVTLSEGALQTADGSGLSAATEDAYAWCINTCEYGFNISQPADGLTAGSQADGQIMMDGSDAVYACIENYDPGMVFFDMAEFQASGSFTASFLQAGKTSFDIAFYTADGSECYRISSYEVTVK